jgi:broad specificity phosphatase PhoE
MSSARRLFLIRHAETKPDPTVPPDHWMLSSTGMRAAQALLSSDERAEIQLVASSPEWKALMTAQALDAGGSIVQVEDLRELNRGPAGWFSNKAEYVALVEEILRSPAESIRGCEPAAQAQERIVHAIDGLLNGQLTHSVAVVSHGIVLGLYMAHLRSEAVADVALWRRLRFPDLAIISTDTGEINREFGS